MDSTERKSRLTWKGVDVETLTRDELLAALYRCHEMLETERRWSRLDSEMNTLFADTAKALRS